MKMLKTRCEKKNSWIEHIHKQVASTGFGFLKTSTLIHMISCIIIPAMRISSDEGQKEQMITKGV